METARFLRWQPFRCVLELLSTGLGGELGEGRIQGGEYFKEESLDFVQLCSFAVPIRLVSPVVWVEHEQCSWNRQQRSRG